MMTGRNTSCSSLLGCPPPPQYISSTTKLRRSETENPEEREGSLFEVYSATLLIVASVCPVKVWVLQGSWLQSCLAVSLKLSQQVLGGNDAEKEVQRRLGLWLKSHSPQWSRSNSSSNRLHSQIEAAVSADWLCRDEQKRNLPHSSVERLCRNCLLTFRADQFHIFKKYCLWAF